MGLVAGNQQLVSKLRRQTIYSPHGVEIANTRVPQTALGEFVAEVCVAANNRCWIDGEQQFHRSARYVYGVRSHVLFRNAGIKIDDRIVASYERRGGFIMKHLVSNAVEQRPRWGR